MTPKQKAEQLLDKMSEQTYTYQPYAGAHYEKDEIGDEAGKKCALIAIDLILNAVGAKDWQNDSETNSNYWEDVKVCLNSL